MALFIAKTDGERQESSGREREEDKQEVFLF